MRVEVRNNNNEPIETLKQFFKLVKRVDPAAAILPWRETKENPIEKLGNLPHHIEEYREYFPKAQSRGRYTSYIVTYRLERPWGSVTRAKATSGMGLPERQTYVC